MNYNEFLQAKVITAPETGFEVEENELSDCLKPHQKQAVMWALRGGRRALFERFGLGKTVQELEFCRLAVKKRGGQALIVLPLGVKQEFTHDAKELLNITPPKYVRNMDEIRAASEPILMTNYERVRDGDIDPTYFTAVSLDEASVLRSFGSKTYQTFLD
ncbi:MAG: DNA methylase N-4, partial [Clostridia bacterium]|nr:DNA methylase N-4 [Clostridia bacterium]